MSTQYKPITAITMGDPAGIGPEIVVGTMLSEEIHDCCRPFVIGSIAIMERAAKVLGKELKYNKIEDPSEAKDACHYATKDVILEDVINIDKELRKVGIENPLIAVAGLNPHNGDNGLFGREEIDEIEPAVKAAQEKGINAIGPCPADSVFHIGKSGKFDAILSLYHDQGHIACKTLDFEKSVTLTFGLPFIRSSVDHGTAFDIAGKGIAGCISMIESTKVVAEYAAKQHEKKEA